MAVVVLGAVAGVTAIVALTLSNRLGSAKDAALAKFQNESRIAIAAADARSAEANTKAAEATRGTADALATAAAANERAGKLELDAATQRERAANAERALLELQQRLAWRVLTREQQRMLSKELSRFADTNVSVWRLGDPEAGPLANQLLGALQEAKWSPAVTNVGVMAPPVFGIRVSHGAGDAAAATLIRLLKSFGLAVTDDPDRGNFQIVVGMKPPA